MNSWVRVGIAMGALSVIRGGAWGFRDVLGRLRTKARYISSFALLFLLAELPEHIAAALAVGHPMLTFISLLLRAAPFFLGLGAAALACEEKGGLSAARRSISLVQEVWPTRFWGHFLIRMPSMAVGMALAVVVFVQAYSGSALTLPTALPGIGLLSLQTIIGIPLLTIGAIFDAALYLRLEQESSAPHPGPPPVLRPGEEIGLADPPAALA